jgi:hypothetical protein
MCKQREVIRSAGWTYLADSNSLQASIGACLFVMAIINGVYPFTCGVPTSALHSIRCRITAIGAFFIARINGVFPFLSWRSNRALAATRSFTVFKLPCSHANINAVRPCSALLASIWSFLRPKKGFFNSSRIVFTSSFSAASRSRLSRS